MRTDLSGCVPRSILLRAAGRALIDLAQTKLRATVGVVAMLHTWGQQLQFHPHVHCVVTGGGFSLSGERWLRVRKVSFLLAVKAISRRFRALVTSALREALASGQMTLPPSIPDPAALERLLGLSCRTDWHAYVKKPFGGPDQVLAYLSSYTHRIAISNRRIVAFDGHNLTFTWHDYKDHYAAKTTTVKATEFLRRFAMHIVPSRFVRIRYFGFLANRVRHKNIALAHQLIASKLRLREPRPAPQHLCPECGTGVMSIVARVAPYIPRTWFDSSRESQRSCASTFSSKRMWSLGGRSAYTLVLRRFAARPAPRCRSARARSRPHSRLTRALRHRSARQQPSAARSRSDTPPMPSRLRPTELFPASC